MKKYTNNPLGINCSMDNIKMASNCTQPPIYPTKLPLGFNLFIF